jgi:hypothetical protein
MGDKKLKKYYPDFLKLDLQHRVGIWTDEDAKDPEKWRRWQELWDAIPNI